LLAPPGSRRVAFGLLLGLVLSGGAVVAGDRARLPPDASVDARVEGRVLRVHGTPPRSLELAVERFEVTELRAGPLPSRPPRRVRVSLFAPLPVAEGARWALPVRLRAPKGPANPGGGDPERAAFRHGLDAVGYLRVPDAARQLVPAPPAAPLATLRDTLGARLEALVPGRPGRLLQALLLGRREALEPAEEALLARTGTVHLLVVSGLHVGLVAAAVLALARLGGLGHRAGAAGVAFVSAAGYAVLTGFGLPARRALLMLAVALWILARGRRPRPGVALVWAAAALVVVDPLAPLDAGAWLSCLAVAALLVLAVPRRTGAGTAAAALLAPQGAVLLVLAAPLLAGFGWFPLLAPLANLVLVPLVALLVLPLGLVALAASVVAPTVGTVGLRVAGAVLETGLATAGRLPDLFLAAGAPAALALLAACLAGLCVLAPLPAAARLAALVLWFASLGPFRMAPPPGHAAVHVLDVGQGLAVVVRTARRTLLYDTGPPYGPDFDAGVRIVLPALRALGVHELDRVVVSHGDADHAGGLASVRAAHPTAEVLGPTALGTDRPCDDGARWRWDGVDFAVLHPAPGPATGADNARSCVLAIRGAGWSVLLPGDVGVREERRLAGGLGPQTLLVAPHHGSRTSSGRALARATRPAFVVIPAGLPSPFRHPHPEVVERWERTGAVVQVTGRDGAVHWDSTEPGRLHCERQTRTRWWHWRPAAGLRCGVRPGP
jgi:competence protein ComEC